MANIRFIATHGLRARTAMPALAIGLLMAPAAWAQDTPDAERSSGQGLEEIVVTAQKRSENLQNVPIAVSTMTADSLESAGIVSTRDLNAAVAGLTLSGFAASTSAAPRRCSICGGQPPGICCASVFTS